MSQEFHVALSDYDEALLIIAGSTALLPEKRHLIAMYQRIWALEQTRELMRKDIEKLANVAWESNAE